MLGAPADDGTPHPRREQVVEGSAEDRAGLGGREAGPSWHGREGGAPSSAQGPAQSEDDF